MLLSLLRNLLHLMLLDQPSQQKKGLGMKNHLVDHLVELGRMHCK
jgi:hypothetical protein